MRVIDSFVDDPDINRAFARNAGIPSLFGLAAVNVGCAARTRCRRRVAAIHPPEAAARGVVRVIANEKISAVKPVRVINCLTDKMRIWYVLHTKKKLMHKKSAVDTALLVRIDHHPDC